MVKDLQKALENKTMKMKILAFKMTLMLSAFVVLSLATRNMSTEKQSDLETRFS